MIRSSWFSSVGIHARWSVVQVHNQITSKMTLRIPNFSTYSNAAKPRLHCHEQGRGQRSYLSFQTQRPKQTLNHQAKRKRSLSSRNPTQQRQKATIGGPQQAASSKGLQQATTATTSTTTTNTSVQQQSWWKTVARWFRQPRTVPIPRWITPSHQTLCISEIFGHSSFVLVAISYAVDDFLMLRCIAVVGSTAMLFFAYFHPHGRALWLPFKWNALFIAINSYRIGIVLWHRHMADNIGPEFTALRNDHFHLMDPVHFAKLVRLGKIESYPKGRVLVQQGEGNRYVRLVLDGELEVLRDGKVTYLLNEANFVSESGLHTGLMLPGAVESCCTVVARSPKARVMTWDRDELLHLLERDKEVQRSLQNAMSWDIVRKLKTQRLLISSNLIDDPEQWTERRNEQTQHRYTAILLNLLQHPRLLNSEEGRVHLHNYRVIHHIDDPHHEAALKECGWTVEQFERGYLSDKDRHREWGDFRHDLNWYLKDIFLRIFG